MIASEWFNFCCATFPCRYLNRTATHPALREDSEFRQFLETENVRHVWFAVLSWCFLKLCKNGLSHLTDVPHPLSRSVKTTHLKNSCRKRDPLKVNLKDIFALNLVELACWVWLIIQTRNQQPLRFWRSDSCHIFRVAYFANRSWLGLKIVYIYAHLDYPPNPASPKSPCFGKKPWVSYFFLKKLRYRIGRAFFSFVIFFYKCSCMSKGIPNGFPCRIAWSCTRDVPRLSESVKILEPQASAFLRFPKVEQHPKWSRYPAWKTIW
jgi:hypothetical protein